MVRETRVQSQVESYQRLKKWYLMLPCLAFSIIRYRSRVKWSNPGKGVAPSPTPQGSSYRKGAFGSPLTMVANFTFFFFLFYLTHLNILPRVHVHTCTNTFVKLIHVYKYMCMYLPNFFTIDRVWNEFNF